MVHDVETVYIALRRRILAGELRPGSVIVSDDIEQSSGLNEKETESLGKVLLDLADEGLAVLLVEHDMGLVMSTCKTIQVLDVGQVIATGTPAQIQANEEVKAAVNAAPARPFCASG